MDDESGESMELMEKIRGLRVYSFYYPTRPVPVGQIFYPTKLDPRVYPLPVVGLPTNIFGMKINEYI